MAESIARNFVLNPTMPSSQPTFNRAATTTTAISCRRPLTTALAARKEGISLTSPRRLSILTASAADTDSPSVPEPEAVPESSPDPFESRLSDVRIRYRSGTGKKAEIRKTRKSNTGSRSGSGSASSVFLPPVPLKKARSGGLKVEFGFTPYSEVLNGRLAGLGLAALLAVELATGKGVINYHSPSIVFLQLYFMAAASAFYLKFEKEKVSIWPPPANK